MCFTRIKNWFRGRSRRRGRPHRGSGTPTPTVTPEDRSIPFVIPHPEEPPNDRQTMDTIDIDGAIEKWMDDYGVPAEHRDFWKTKIAIKLDSDLRYPAAAQDYRGGRLVTIRPEFVNSGVIAHEQAHNSYALLSGRDKKAFSKEYSALKGTDPLIVKLYEVNGYGLTNDVEGHAELYRYLNEYMPRVLKKYYPGLITAT